MTDDQNRTPRSPTGCLLIGGAHNDKEHAALAARMQGADQAQMARNLRVLTTHEELADVAALLATIAAHQPLFTAEVIEAASAAADRLFVIEPSQSTGLALELFGSSPALLASFTGPNAEALRGATSV